MGPSGLPLLRTSERGTFKRCRWKWWLEFDQKVKPKVDSEPLWLGSLIHESLAAYYPPGVKRGRHPCKTFESKFAEFVAINQGDREEVERWYTAAEMGMDMLHRYVQRYQGDEDWEVICTEHPFQVVVNHPLRKTPWFWYTGIMDGIWKQRSGPKARQKLLIVDHKTAKSIQLKGLSLSDQATAYWTWGIEGLINKRIVPPGTKPDGMMFNFMRKAPADKRPMNEDGLYTNKPTRIHYINALACRGVEPETMVKSKLADLEALALKKKINVFGDISEKQPSEYHHRELIFRTPRERDLARKTVLWEYADIEAVRGSSADTKGDVAGVYKNPSDFNCNGCWAFDICELHQLGADYKELMDLTTRGWEPYSAHETYISETR